MFATLLQVALGGALGASARYLTGVAALRLIGTGFPWATLFVNVAGSFLMGVLVIWFGHRDLTRLAPLLMTGLLGGFTTFSAFSLDAVSLWQGGDTTGATFYVGASVALSLAALFVGMSVARGVLA
ncbi:fluoride efflux transporter CrcB [Frigidibacter sp. SD6-1]|uniref:fluoride efflux transporter CrcB n=1 Tax=Frigidibacter sp. SD6-1 TaxID=3032581 RepID=UPI0024DF6A1D|nr:fluoride efflux transporter CrcB [Frigidibacter sp. SD6-1]